MIEEALDGAVVVWVFTAAPTRLAGWPEIIIAYEIGIAKVGEWDAIPYERETHLCRCKVAIMHRTCAEKAIEGVPKIVGEC